MNCRLSWTESYESLPKGIKLLIQLFFGGFFGGIYRIVRFFENGRFLTLFFGMVFLLTGAGNVVAWILDFLTEYSCNRICVLAN